MPCLFLLLVLILSLGLSSCGTGGSYSEPDSLVVDHPTPTPTPSPTPVAESYPSASCATQVIENGVPNQLLVFEVNWRRPEDDSTAIDFPVISWDMDVADFQNPAAPIYIVMNYDRNTAGTPYTLFSDVFTLVTGQGDLFNNEGPTFSYAQISHPPVTLPANASSFTVSIDLSNDLITPNPSPPGITPQVNTILQLGPASCSSCFRKECSFALH